MFTIALIISAIEFFISGDLLWGFGCLIAIGVLWGIIFLIDALIEKHKRKERTPIRHVYPSPPSPTKPEEPTEKDRKTFSSNINYYLQLREKTPQSLEQYLRISDERLEALLNAKEFPSDEEQMKISQFLKIPWSKLMQETNHNDEAIKDNVFKKATLLIYMMSQMSDDDEKTAERYIELLYNQENGY